MKIFYQKGLVALTHRASSRARGLTAQCKHTAATRTDSRDRQTRAALAGESRLIRGGRSGGGVLGPGGTVSGGNEKAEWERSGAAGEKTRGGGGGGGGGGVGVEAERRGGRENKRRRRRRSGSSGVRWGP
jgi:hypothetical protein